MNDCRAFRKLLPLAQAAAWLAVVAMTCPAPAAPRAPHPCTADGVCLPKRDTWGWYQTNWRAWPGERVHPVPTEARPSEPTPGGEEDLGEVELPPPSREDLATPASPKERPAAAPAPPAAPAGLPPAPAPQAPAAPKANPAPLNPPPTEDPLNELPALDSFGARPSSGARPSVGPAPRGDVSRRSAAVIVPSLPVAVAPAPSTPATAEKAVATMPPAPDLPAEAVRNLGQEDAPPSLPATLRRSAWRQALPSAVVDRYGVAAGNRSPVGASAPRRDAAVAPAAALTSGDGIRLANPAAGPQSTSDPAGLQHAIYLEATDQDAIPVKLPADNGQ